jgi:hypothetical protein
MQLPLIQDPSLMQTKWKSILDPVIAAQDRQIVIGQAQIAASSTTSATYVTLTTSPTVSFTANNDGMYKIYGTFNAENTANGAKTFLRIFPTQGSPQVMFSQEAITGEDAAASPGQSISPFILVTLKANTIYTFTLQMRVNTGTGTLRNDLPASGTALIVEQIG